MNDTPTHPGLNEDASRREAQRIDAELHRLDGGTTDPFAAAVRATRMPMIVTDPRQPDNPVVFCNDAFCRLTGYPREEVLGRNCRFLQGPESDPSVVARVRAAVDAAEAIEVDLRNYRKDGSQFWNRLLLAPVRDGNGEVAYFFASQLDVTIERERLVRLETRNAALADELAERVRQQAALLALADRLARPGQADVIAAATDALSGALGPVTVDVLPAEAAEVAGTPLGRGGTLARTQGDGRPQVTVPLRRDGRLAAVMQVHRPAHALAAREIQLIEEVAARCWDAMERARVGAELHELNATLEARVEARTAELREAEAALRQSQKMEAVGQLTGGLAHDFNNLLTGITGALELLQRRVAQGRLENLQRYTDVARDGAERAAALTQRLLAFARRQPLDPRTIDPNRLISGMEELLRRTIGPTVPLELRLGAEVWPLLCDPSQLESALLNLAINARDAMPDGGRLIFATANLEAALLGGTPRAANAEPQDMVAISVTDTGVGMEEEVIARAFEPFFTTKPIGQGTGLGLSMLYGFVRQSGGEVRITSALGEGTRFDLLLPRYVGEVTAEPAPDADEAEPSAATVGRVLVVDDETAVRMVVTEVLDDMGCAVVQASDSESALRVLQSDISLDLMITDVGLPGLNGRQLADAARAVRPALKVLFITGFAGSAAMGHAALEAGMQMMTKPFAMEALAERVRDMLHAG